MLPESVEWMNTLLAIVWGLINPDMFSGVADMLEDVMQASVPGVIENVRVDHFSIIDPVYWCRANPCLLDPKYLRSGQKLILIMQSFFDKLHCGFEVLPAF